jgi:hypothetical protein
MNQVLPKFKRLRIDRSPTFAGFGFKINKKIKPKYTAYDVANSSPAAWAGLTKMDVLIEINGKNIRRLSFETVCYFLTEAYNEHGGVTLLVISQEGYLWYKKRGKKFSRNLAIGNTIDIQPISNVNVAISRGRCFDIMICVFFWNPVFISENSEENISSDEFSKETQSLNEEEPQFELPDEPPPHLTSRDIIDFYVAKTDNEIIDFILNRHDSNQSYGFSILMPKERGSTILPVPVIEKIEMNSPAALAGLKTKDQIFEINGKSTYQEDFAFVAGLIGNSEQELHMVISRDLNFVRI